jgi:anti-sigma factor RsiW
VHPFGDLSAYLDGALSTEARASVQAHLDTCALCRTRLAELRGTARLIAGLPMPVPSRSLVPRVSVSPWMAPLRAFSTFASAAAIFVFLASAVISSFPRLSSAGSAPAAAPAAAATAALDQARGGASSAPAAPQSSDDALYRSRASASGSPSGAFNVVGSPTPAPAEGAQTATGAAKRVDASSASPSSELEIAARSAYVPQQAPFNPFPWVWLVLAVVFAALSFILGRRLRSA